MTQETDGLAKATEDGAGKMMDNARAMAEFTEAENVAAYTPLDNSIQSANTKETIYAKQLSRDEEKIVSLAKTLESHRENFRQYGTTVLANFRAQVADEKKQLDE